MGDFNISLFSTNPERIYARYHLTIFEEQIQCITESLKEYQKCAGPSISQGWKIDFLVSKR